MSTWRTVYPRDTLSVALPDGSTVVIDSTGVAVADAYDQTVRDAAAAAHVQLATGGISLPSTSSTEQRIANLEAALRGVAVPLVEQTQRATSGAVVRSGQLVPVRPADAATAAVTITLEPGATGSRAGVRYDGGPAAAPVTLAGTGSDSVPPIILTAAGSTVFLEGIVGGGGWRVVSLYQPSAATIPWSQISGAPTIPTRFDQLSGSVPDANIPSAITRDSELTAAVSAAVAALVGSAPGALDTIYELAAALQADESAAGALTSRVTTLENRPAVEIRLTADYSGLSGNTWYTLRGQMAAPSGMDPYGMFTQPGGSGQPYQLVVPTGWDGRWELIWQVAATSTAYNPMLLVGMLGAPNTPSGTEFTDYIAFRNQVPGMGQVVGSAKLVAGDKVSLGVYAAQSGTWTLSTLVSGLFRTKAVLRYAGRY